MKKLILGALLVSSLSADQCLFWANMYSDNMQLFTLSAQDRDYASVRYEYENIKTYARYVQVHCDNRKEVLDMVMENKKGKDEFIKIIEGM